MSRKLHISVCGRCELAGNHVDHQGGKVVCASVNRSIEMDLVPTGNSVVTLQSENFEEIVVDLADLSPHVLERGISKALVRGMAAGVLNHGWKPAGFDAVMSSDIPVGGGLSSSAAFEVALGAAFCILARPDHGTAFTQEELLAIARMGQAAENDYFGKPCGLMDEAACALGGLVALDFSDKLNPKVERIAATLPWDDLALCMVDCGANHSCAIGDYASIPLDMHAIAGFFGKEVLSQVEPDDFWANLPKLRNRCGDRATLRAMHYFDETALVEKRIDALKAADKSAFLENTRLSGRSSTQLLQNVSVAGAGSQPAMIALALSQKLAGNDGAARIHGGGFGGSIQVFVPKEQVAGFKEELDRMIGFDSVSTLEITSQGVTAQWS